MITPSTISGVPIPMPSFLKYRPSKKKIIPITIKNLQIPIDPFVRSRGLYCLASLGFSGFTISFLLGMRLSLYLFLSYGKSCRSASPVIFLHTGKISNVLAVPLFLRVTQESEHFLIWHTVSHVKIIQLHFGHRNLEAGSFSEHMVKSLKRLTAAVRQR